MNPDYRCTECHQPFLNERNTNDRLQMFTCSCPDVLRGSVWHGGRHYEADIVYKENGCGVEVVFLNDSVPEEQQLSFELSALFLNGLFDGKVETV